MGTDINFGEIEEVLGRILGESMGFEDMVEQMLTDGRVLSPGKWMELFGNALITQLKNHGQTIGHLLLMIISAAVLTTIAKAIRNRQISDMGFYMIYLLLFLIMMRSFGTCYTLTEKVIADLIDFMKVLMPAYLMAAAVSSYRTSAVVYYEGFLLLIYYLQKAVAVFLLPGIRCYVLISMLGHLGKEDFLSRGKEGLKKLLLFLMKGMIGVTAGMQMIQGMLTPAVDEFKQSAISKGLSSLGGIGNLMGNVTDVVIGSGVLLKNGIGVAAAILVVVICLVPVVQTGCYAVFYQLLAAAAEPISDKRLTKAIGQMGDGIGLLVRLLFSVCTIFLLTIAIICVTTGGMK